MVILGEKYNTVIIRIEKRHLEEKAEELCQLAVRPWDIDHSSGMYH